MAARTLHGFLVLLLVGTLHARIRLENPGSPDTNFLLFVTPSDAGCVVTIAPGAGGKVLARFPVDGLWDDSAGEYLTAVWAPDSQAVALNARCGRSITKCLVLCLADGKWQQAAFPADLMESLSKRNNIPDEKSQEYLEASAWQPHGGLAMTYQGNIGIVQDLVFTLARKSPPSLKCIKAVARPN